MDKTNTIYMEQLASLGQAPIDNTAGEIFKKGEKLMIQNAKDKDDPEFEEFSSRDKISMESVKQSL